jgi:hypothetical protein
MTRKRAHLYVISLQDALLAKRSSVQGGSALAAKLDRAIALVDAFREQYNNNDDTRAFARLKEEVRVAMVPQVSTPHACTAARLPPAPAWRAAPHTPSGLPRRLPLGP